MTRAQKFGIVLGGYAAAFLLTCAMYYVLALVRVSENGSGGGMQAFGDSLLLLGVFGVLSLVPTVLMLYFLRPLEKFWTVFSVASLVLAATGAVAASLIGRPAGTSSAIMFAGLFGLLKVLGSPLFGFAFVVCALISPARSPRRMLLAAAGLEFAVGAYGFFCLFILGHWAL